MTPFVLRYEKNTEQTCMKKNIASILFAAGAFIGLTIFSVDASGPGQPETREHGEQPSGSPLWQHLFVERKAMEKYPVALIGQSVDIKEPFAPQIQRTLQVLMTRSAYWVPGKTDPLDEDILFNAAFECSVTRQHWPVNTFFDDRCSRADVQSDWLTPHGQILLTEFLRHYWNRSPRIHYVLLQNSAWDRQEDQQAQKTDIHIQANLRVTFGDLRKLSAYFISHRMITERKLKEFTELNKKLESYYAYGEVPIPLEE